MIKIIYTSSLLLLFVSFNAFSQEVPVKGTSLKGIKLIDTTMLSYYKKIPCTAASITVSKDRKQILSRSYGWVDQSKKIVASPSVIIGIASCEKPVTKAAIIHLFKKENISLDTPIIDLLRVNPYSSSYDERVHKITVRHVLDHKTGWGANPLNHLPNSTKVRLLSVDKQLRHILSSPLVAEPGEKSEYCNFGYDLLRHILFSVTHKTPSEYFNQALMKKRKGFYPGNSQTPSNSLVWNLAQGGPIAASTPTLCNFMEKYWLTGEPRKDGNPLWIMYGSLDGSTAIMEWRSDGLNIAILFNGRGNVSHDEIRLEINRVLDVLIE